MFVFGVNNRVREDDFFGFWCFNKSKKYFVELMQFMWCYIFIDFKKQKVNFKNMEL